MCSLQHLVTSCLSHLDALTVGQLQCRHKFAAMTATVEVQSVTRMLHSEAQTLLCTERQGGGES